MEENSLALRLKKEKVFETGGILFLSLFLT